jgi:hypothetical protein
LSLSEREAAGWNPAAFLHFATSSFDAANMPSLMIIVFLVEATVKFINAVGAAKINDLVRPGPLPPAFWYKHLAFLVLTASFAAMDPDKLPPRADLQGCR